MNHIFSELELLYHWYGFANLLPALFLPKLGMHEVQALERVIFVNTSVHVNAAFLAGVALDNGLIIDNFEFVLARLDFELFYRNDADDGEEGAIRLPAFGAAASMVVRDIA